MKTLLRKQLEELDEKKYMMNRQMVWDDLMGLLGELVDRIEALESGSVKAPMYAERVVSAKSDKEEGEGASVGEAGVFGQENKD